MAWLGMNDDVVQQQSSVLQQQAEAIQKLIAKVDAEVASLKQSWHGPDSLKFEQEWTGTHKPLLQKCKTLLEQMKQKIDEEIRQQRQTSESY